MRTCARLALLLMSCCLFTAGAGAGSCWPGAVGTDPKLCPPNDPSYPSNWEYLSRIPDEIDRSRLHPSEAALGSIGMSVDTAWQHTIGRDDVVIAVLDSGILWDYKDLVRKLYLNPGELPLPEGSSVWDKNGDGIFNIDDYEGDSRVGDRNGNGILDPGDLILAFSNCRDDDGNGYVDDICGYDFFEGAHCGATGGDNDPSDDVRFHHGTGIASAAAAETNNGIDEAGACPRCRVLPVRVGDSFVVDANRFARGVVFAVNAGASVIGSALGSYNNTPTARRAVDYAYARGVPIIASAADELAYHHNYPSVYGHAFYVNTIRFNHADEYRKANTFWGMSPCTNFGARVSVTVPGTTCSSGSTARLAGIAGLIESAARDAGVAPLATEELYQVLRMTTDDLDNTSPDWGSLYYRALKGFDTNTGYGRVNALKAVLAVEGGRIPPIADLAAPDWFEIVSPAATPRVAVTGSIRVPRAERATYALEYALGVEPRDDEFVPVASGAVSGSKDGTLGTLDFEKLPKPAGPAPRTREDRDRYSVTLRLRVTDDRGLMAESRRSFFVLDDPDWMKFFPRYVGASGEAAPVVADLDGDGRDEIILATADGTIRILRWDASGVREQRLLLDPGPPLGPTGSEGPQDPDARPRETIIREPVVTDLLGRGEMAIVVASREGKVYAFNSRGERLKGFPVSVRKGSSRPAAPTSPLETGILSKPVLADLDGKRGKEIIVTALDGNVYAWHGDGKPLAGFPVAVEDPRTRKRSKLVSTPAVGDIDGDGRPEIVLGSNGVSQGLGAAYAIHADGTLHPGGPFLKGWDPFEMALLRGVLLPTLATGVQMTPVLVDVDGDGDMEVILYGVTGSGIFLLDHRPGAAPAVLAKYSLLPGTESELQGISFIASPGSPIVTDTDGDGELELYAPLLPLRILTLRTNPGVPLDVPPTLGGWAVRPAPAQTTPIPMIPNYPRRMEDLTLLSAPLAADVDGDGSQEILLGSGGYLLHAFKKVGGEADGFPKFTGGWIFSSPAVGDLDGDGEKELVSVTREGYLFVWRLRQGLPPRAAAALPAR
jgi:subtilase family protein/FG-GAP repeat protein